MARTKLKPDELYTCICSVGPVQAGTELLGSDEAVRLWPAYFSLVSEGQRGIDEKSAALRADIDLAAKHRERAWYGPPESEAEPVQLPTVRSRRDFRHNNYVIKGGVIFDASHPVVIAAPAEFEPAV